MNTFSKALTAPLLAGVALFTTPALAQEASAAEQASAAMAAVNEAVAEETGPALWKVADEDTTIYLFGTVHALPKDVDWFKGDISEALTSSDTVVTEILMDETVGPRMQKLVMTTGIMPPGKTLRSLLDEEQKATFETAMGKIGMPAGAFDQFEPWYAAMMLTMLPLLQQGYSPDSGVEQVLMNKADGKGREALETIEFQLGVFDNLPMDTQLSFLIETAGSIDDVKPMLDKMVAEWLEGDAETLAQLMNEGLTDKTLAESLLYARNRTWASWIDERLDEPGTVFVAVGAGHLAGEQSVQDILEEGGLTIHRVQ